MSASPKTMKGARPPSSKEHFLMVEEACFMRRRPTGVCPGIGEVSACECEGGGRTNGSGEGDLANGRVGGELETDVLGVGVGADNVDNTLRDSRTLGELDEGEGGERRLRGRLDDDRASGGESGSELARDHGQGEAVMMISSAYGHRLKSG